MIWICRDCDIPCFIRADVEGAHAEPPKCCPWGHNRDESDAMFASWEEYDESV